MKLKINKINFKNINNKYEEIEKNKTLIKKLINK